jgi:hypothetical protein
LSIAARQPAARVPLAWRAYAPEIACLAVLSLWGLAPLLILFVGLPGYPAIARGAGTFTGSSGLALDDQLQYIAWIRDSGEHVLFSNRFDTPADPHLFLHPMWLLSGLAWKLGASLQLSFIAWKPLAVIGLLIGFAAYVRRFFEQPWERFAGLALALFFVTPTMTLVGWFGTNDAAFRYGSFAMGLEMFPAGFVWDLAPTAIALGLMPLFLLGAERILEPSRRDPRRSLRWYVGGISVAGLFVSWLHPWQGLTLLAIVAGVAAWQRFPRAYLRLALPIAATALPLLYYSALTHTDSAWAVVSRPGGYPHLGDWFVLGLAPLFLLALPGALVGSRRSFQDRALLVWPLVSVAVYLSLHRSFIYHALAGMTLPLAILAVRGWRQLRLPVLAGAVVALLLTVPGVAVQLKLFRRDAPSHFLTPGESDAVRYLERSRAPGAVLAPVELGRSVPALAGRNTWVGHPTWTPNYEFRKTQAAVLFAGTLRPIDARRFVRSTGVAFLLADCVHRRGLRPLLGRLVRSERHFGCATVYELRRPLGA